jgi:hypothetical protein
MVGTPQTAGRVETGTATTPACRAEKPQTHFSDDLDDATRQAGLHVGRRRMPTRTIRLSSRALGEKRRVIVRIYDNPAEMRKSAEKFNGSDHHNSAGITQAYCDSDGRITVPVILLTRGYLSAQIVTHELHHATTAIYAPTLPSDALATDVLTHYNEAFAHLYSDMLRRLIDSLYRFEYYD